MSLVPLRIFEVQAHQQVESLSKRLLPILEALNQMNHNTSRNSLKQPNWLMIQLWKINKELAQ
jgi:hypothetical protein